jgi:hypothetical protein
MLSMDETRNLKDWHKDRLCDVVDPVERAYYIGAISVLEVVLDE